MRIEVLLAGLLLLSDASLAAQAGPGLPVFSQTERDTIRRNELLGAIVDRDPWTVRRVLDLLAAERSQRSSLPSGIDPALNPDLAQVPRSFDGSAEWIALLKEARDRKAGKVAEPPADARSAESRLETADVLARVRALKEQQGKDGRIGK